VACSCAMALCQLLCEESIRGARDQLRSPKWSCRARAARLLLGAAAYRNSVATSDRVAHRTWSAPCTSGSLVHAAEDRLRLLAGVRDVAVGIAGLGRSAGPSLQA
jgi:hypothetical protein